MILTADASIVVVVHSCNDKEWVKKNLDSIFTQTHLPSQVLYIDDASTDGTNELVLEYAEQNALQGRLVLLRNEHPKGATACLSQALQSCSAKEIILPLGGSDWLAHRDVLKQVASLYTDSSVSSTYAEALSYPSYYTDSRPCITAYAQVFNEHPGSNARYIPEVHCIRQAPQIPLIPKERKKIYITPGYWGELFAIDNPIFNRDGCLDVLYRLREVAQEAGYDILQADDLNHLDEFEYLIVFDVFLDQLALLEKYPKEKKILFLWEPPSVIPENYDLNNHLSFSKVMTWNDALVDGKKYFKFRYPVLHPMIPKAAPFESKQLCTLIACNKNSSYPGELYSERRYLIQFYENSPFEDFSLFGKWWPETLRTYQGPIDKKVDCLKSFRFCYAYENIRGIPGYITEKIFDCFQAAAVPIYWGAPNISCEIPKNCYISREEFPSDYTLYSYLKNMDEAAYSEYQRNIRSYLESEKAQAYSQEHFINLFMKLIL
jgi:alpha(1,3/1,4) fucosyltransferase